MTKDKKLVPIVDKDEYKDHRQPAEDSTEETI